MPREVPGAEVTDAPGAATGGRTGARLGCRSGHDGRAPTARVGEPGPRVPRDRDGRFSTGPFERCRRPGRALVASPAETGARPPAGGAGPGRPDAEGEGGHRGAARARLPASAASAAGERPDGSPAALAGRRLEDPLGYLTPDARHGKVREAGVVGGRAVPIAVGIDREGRRRALAVEPADREGRPSREDLPPGSRERGLPGVVLVAADEHAGPRAAPREALPDAFVQRRHVRLPRDAPDHPPREADGGCPKEPRRTGARPPAGGGGPPRAGRGRGGPRRPARGVGRPPRQADEPGGEGTGETFAYHRPPRRHRKHTGSADMPERSSEGRGSSGARASCASSRTRRAARGRCPRWPSIEARESRPGAGRHPTMDDLGGRKKPRLRRAA